MTIKNISTCFIFNTSYCQNNKITYKSEKLIILINNKNINNELISVRTIKFEQYYINNNNKKKLKMQYLYVH